MNFEESTTLEQTMKTITSLLRMAWINPGKLLHITTSNKTVHHHEPQFRASLQVIVPKIDSPAVDDRPYNDLPNLPTDIILDILSRLPAKCIFECQSVSRPLQVLTTTTSFIHMQRQQSTSAIVVQLSSESNCECTKLYYLDNKFENIEEKFTRPRSVAGSNLLLGSYDGFLMFASVIGFPKAFYMWNPITGEELTMKDNMHACGLYFNPFTKDYELLYYTTSGKYCNYSVYCLRTKLRRHVGRFSYPPSRYRPPVIVKGTLYWMIDREHYNWLNRGFYPPFSDSIMSFDIETEEFSTLEPGGHKYSTTEPRGGYSDGMLRIGQLHLSEIDGELCLCDFNATSNENELVLSIFNHASRCWSTRPVVILPEYDLVCLYDGANKFAAEVIEIKKNELLVRQGRRLLLYNMLSRAYKISEIMGSAKKGIRVTVHSDRTSSFGL